MWFAVKTQGGKKEEDYKAILADNISQVKDVYLPYRHRTFKDQYGRTQRRYELAVKGYMFVNVDVVDATDESKRDVQTIWSQLKNFITPAGYFYWHEKETTDGSEVAARVTVPIRLLSPDPKTATPEQLIEHSLIPERAMEIFRYFNEQSLGGDVDAFLVNESFNRIARENDVVRIISGPLAGQEGVLVQESDGINRKDRRLVAKFGNSLTVHYPNIRKYNMVVVREAAEGEKSKASRLWYAIDRMIAVLQAVDKDEVDNAAINLRAILAEINKQPNNDAEGKMRVIDKVFKSGLSNHVKENRRLLYLLASMFPPAVNPNFNAILEEYIPDTKIRPFLTPQNDASPIGKLEKRVLNHKNFTEHIIPVDLRDAFRESIGTEATYTNPKESYIYEAHVAIFDKGKAIVSWGAFYDRYESLDDEGKKAFVADLAKKNYKYLHALLSTGIPLGEENQANKISFVRIDGVGGFSINLSGDITDSELYLVNNVAKAAVELWQGTRLLEWRQLAQRSVIIHNCQGL